MKTCTYATTKMSKRPGSGLRITSDSTIRGGCISRLGIKRPMKSIMLRRNEEHLDRRGARSPHGGIRLSSFGAQGVLILRAEDWKAQPPTGGHSWYFSPNGKCWKRTDCEVNKFNTKNCLDKWVHYN